MSRSSEHVSKVKRRILIAGEDASAELSVILRSRGFEVSSASTATEMLRRVRSELPDLILLDDRMSGSATGDSIELLQQRWPGRVIPFLFLTERSDLAMQRRGWEIGAADVLCRPFEEGEVIARVRTHADQAIALRQSSAIPERARANEREEWVRFAMQAGQMAAFEWDASTGEAPGSRCFTTVMGTEGEAAWNEGENWFRQIHPDDLPRFLKLLSLLSPDYNTYDTHYRLARSGRTPLHLRESARAYFDQDRRLVRLTGVISDITEQEERTDALLRSERERLDLIQKIPIPMVLMDGLGGIRYVNDRFVQAFGYELEETAKPEVWWSRAFPQEKQREQVMRVWKESGRLENRGFRDSPVEQYRLTCKNGETRIVEIFGATVGDRKLLFFDDVTERRRAEVALVESENRFQAMADTAPVMLWVSGPDKRFTFFNQMWLRYTGRTLEEERGEGWAWGIHPDDRERCVRTYATAFDAREAFSMEYRLRRASGEYGWIVDQGVPRFTADRTFAGYIGSAIDVSAVKRNQEQLLATQKLESLGVLANGIAHDFNNLIGCILAYADICMVDAGVGSPAQDGIRKIEMLALRASEIVGQINVYAEPGETNKEPIELAQLLNEMVDLLRVSVPKGAQMRVDLAEDLPVLHANAAQIRQVLMNLILNAAESLGKENGRITIRARRKQIRSIRSAGAAGAASDDYIWLEIADTGSGMTEAVRARIFDPFFTTKFTGRGLGLAAVRRIVQQHGGHIEVTTAPGKGTRFQIMLPCAGAVSEPAPEPAVPAPAASVPNPAPTQVLLVVEHDEALRAQASALLRDRSFPVLEARDEEDALELISEGRELIAAAMLDTGLPVKMSLQIARELRGAHPGIKLILVSDGERESIPEPLAAMDGWIYLRKPYGTADLLTAVQRALPRAITAA